MQEGAVRASLLHLDAIYRNWARDVFTGGADQPLMVFVASRRP